MVESKGPSGPKIKSPVVPDEESNVLFQLSHLYDPDIYRGIRHVRSADHLLPTVNDRERPRPEDALPFFDPARPEAGSVDLAAQAFKEHPTMPGVVEAVMRRYWIENSKLIGGEKLEVDKLNLTSDELRRMQRQGRTPFYLPARIAGEGGINLLDKMLPELDLGQVIKPAFLNADKITTQPGWWSVDTSPIAPNLRITEADAIQTFNEQNREIIDLTTYIALVGFTHLIYGDRPDVGTFSRVKLDDRLLIAGFDPEPVNRLHIYGTFGDRKSRDEYSHHLVGARSKGKI